MGKRADLVGKRFGMLTVVQRTDERRQGYMLWRCRCDCGAECLASTKNLTRGAVTSCGCVKRAPREGFEEDLTGRRFGRLTALRRAEGANGGARWVCLCDCGKEYTALARDLRAGRTTSCGCRRKLDIRSITNIAGQRFGRLIALCPTPRRDKKGSVYWTCLCDCGKELEITEDSLVHGNYRSCGCLKQEIQKDIAHKLHRIDGTCVEWLEKRKHRSDNTSGFRGVNRMKDGRYRASIGFKRRRYHIGTYGTFDEAVEARLEAEAQIHDGFVRAYRLWAERQDGEAGEPLIFEVKKQGGRFEIITNARGACGDPQAS